MTNRLLTVLVFATCSAANTLAHAAPDARADNSIFSLTNGFDFNSGRYGTPNAAGIVSGPAISEYEAGPWTFKVVVPSTRISGTRGTVPMGTNVSADGTTGDTPTKGDTVAAASYNIYSGKESTFGIDLTGKVKLNASSPIFGISQNDYAAQADAYQSFNRFTAVGSLGYKVLGSTTRMEMDGAIYGTLGGSYRLDDHMNGGVDVSLSQGSPMSGEGRRELSAYVSRKINKNFRAKGYVLKDFSSGSPDNSLGAQIYYGF